MAFSMFSWDEGVDGLFIKVASILSCIFIKKKKKTIASGEKPNFSSKACSTELSHGLCLQVGKVIWSTSLV